jgi:uncharacterized protein YndB with AHSA1/START domain
MPDTTGKPVFLYVTYIAVPPQMVWEAITTSAFTTRFFFGRSVESDWKQGSPWTLRMPDGRPDVEGRVVVSEPPHRLHLTWRVVWIPEMADLPETLVTWEIEAVGEVSRLTVCEFHGGPMEEKYLEGGRKGWPMILSGLKTLLETGKALDLATPGAPG